MRADKIAEVAFRPLLSLIGRQSAEIRCVRFGKHNLSKPDNFDWCLHRASLPSVTKYTEQPFNYSDMLDTPIIVVRQEENAEPKAQSKGLSNSGG